VALPRHEFTMGLIAPKGAGKTTVLCNLLDFYRGFFHEIFVFSPTIESDEKWDWVKKQKFLKENTKLRKWKEKMKQEGLIRDVCEGVDKPFDGIIPKENFFDVYTDESFREKMEEQKKVINALKEQGKTKHTANRILAIFDDQIGSELFNPNRKSYFKGINTRHRHLSLSILMVSQGYKEIPKTIRTNWTCLLLFEIGNEREILVIYEEFAMGLKYKHWISLYDYATREEHSFLFIDFQKKRGRRIMKNFQEYLIPDLPE
jgi:hypothetical protein